MRSTLIIQGSRFKEHRLYMSESLNEFSQWKQSYAVFWSWSHNTVLKVKISLFLHQFLYLYMHCLHFQISLWLHQHPFFYVTLDVFKLCGSSVLNCWRTPFKNKSSFLRVKFTKGFFPLFKKRNAWGECCFRLRWVNLVLVCWEDNNDYEGYFCSVCVCHNQHYGS